MYHYHPFLRILIIQRMMLLLYVGIGASGGGSGGGVSAAFLSSSSISPFSCRSASSCSIRPLFLSSSNRNHPNNNSNSMNRGNRPNLTPASSKSSSSSSRSSSSSSTKHTRSSSSSSSGFGFGSSSSSPSSLRSSMRENPKKPKKNPIDIDSSLLFPSFPFSGSIRPYPRSPPQQRQVLDPAIVKPNYYITGIPKPIPMITKPKPKPQSNQLQSKKKNPFTAALQNLSMNHFPAIEVKNDEDIAKMRVAGRVARQVLDQAGQAVTPGITTADIDALVYDLIVNEYRAYPSPLNYHGFPASCCTSVNEVICHGIPDTRPLQAGDLINIDITVFVEGVHGDCSEMFVVGGEDALADDPQGKALLQTTYDAWILACQSVHIGKPYKDIGAIIEDYVNARGLTSVRNFCGHGVGATFHCAPNILHVRNQEPNGMMRAGHTFTIEPMICEGVASSVLNWPDGWTATTTDGKRSAQFEHTLLIVPNNDERDDDENNENGMGAVEALTGKTADSPIQFWERDSAIHQGVWLGTSNAAKRQMDMINHNHSQLQHHRFNPPQQQQLQQ